MATDGLYLAPRTHSEGRLVPIPPAWSYWISLGFRATGPRYDTVLVEALALAILSLPLAFLVGWLEFRRPVPAVALALFVAVLPIHLRMSGSAALENGSFFFLLLAWVAVLAWQQERRPAWLYAGAAAAAWMMNWRMENPFAVVPVMGLVALLRDPEPGRTLREPRVYVALALAGLLALPGLVADLYGVGRDFYLFYGSEAERFEQVRQNMGNNLLYWWDGRIHPRELTLLAVLGLATWRPRREALAWLVWVGLLVFFYSRTPSADFGLHHTLDSWRNALQPALGVLVLAAAGVEALRTLASPLPRPVLRATLALAAVAFLALPLRYGDFVHRRHVWLQEFRLLQEASRRLPEGAHLLLDGKPEHLGDPALRVATLGYATNLPWGLLMLPEDSFRRPGQGRPPQILVDVENWTSVAGSRVFLYYFGRNRSGWDYYRLRWLQDHLRLRVVAGLANPVSECTFTLYEVDGLEPAGLRWLRGGGD